MEQQVFHVTVLKINDIERFYVKFAGLERCVYTYHVSIFLKRTNIVCTRAEIAIYIHLYVTFKIV